MTLKQREEAVQGLRKACPRLRAVIAEVGPCRLKMQRDRFGMLGRSILYQQLSGHAAKAIHDRLLGALPEGRFTPEGLGALSDAQYRASGVSAQKTKYLRSLAESVDQGAVRLERIGRLSDDEIIQQLTQVKGIGVWTAQMFLMFSLGRPDVLPWLDLGVRQAIQNLFVLNELPAREACEESSDAWRPYRTVASWYCWRSLELENKGVFFE